MKHAFPIFLSLIATPLVAEGTRELGAHEHGVGELNIAVDGGKIAMEFHAPGADIVGFEYEAESAEDRAAIDEAVATLAKPLELFVFPASAECNVTQASAELEHEEHGHDEHGHEAHEEHEHEEHAEHEHEEHGEHEHEAHEEHEHEEHAEHDNHDDHEEHADASGHSEFHAEYTLNCGSPDAISEITFAYFGVFENARELEVQIVTQSGAKAFEVERDAPTLDLRGMF